MMLSYKIKTFTMYHKSIKREHKLAVSILLMATLYFLGHSLIGKRGLFNVIKLNQQLSQSTQELSELTIRKNILEKRIYGLNEKSLDLDLLDEQARSVLGHADKNDTVMYDQ